MQMPIQMVIGAMDSAVCGPVALAVVQIRMHYRTDTADIDDDEITRWPVHLRHPRQLTHLSVHPAIVKIVSTAAAAAD